MVCGGTLRSLDQLLELAPEHVIHFQPARDFFGDIQPMRPSRIEIHFLQDQYISLRTGKELYDPLQFLATVDDP